MEQFPQMDSFSQFKFLHGSYIVIMTCDCLFNNALYTALLLPFVVFYQKS